MSVYIPTFETKNKSQFLTQDENATGLNQGQMIHFCDGDCNEQKNEKLATKSWIDNNRLPNGKDALAKSEPFLVFCITNATIGFREQQDVASNLLRCTWHMGAEIHGAAAHNLLYLPTTKEY